MDWNAVVDALGPRLYRYFCGAFLPAIAEDLVQETLLRLVRAARSGTFDPEKGTLTMLAYGIANNVRRETLRSTGRYLALLTRAAAEPPPGGDPHSDAGARLRSSLTVLGDTERQVLLLLIDEELSLTEISSLLDIPVGTLKSYIHRAKHKLRAFFDAEESDEGGGR